MFDLTSSKLMILGLVALIVVGPKDLPLLLRTIGKYVGLIRRHANDFRAQFDEAMRDQELANLKAEMEAVKRDVQDTLHDAHQSVRSDVTAATQHIEHHIHTPHPASTSGTQPALASEPTIEHPVSAPGPDATLHSDHDIHAPKAGA